VGSWWRPGAGVTWATILRIAPTTGYVALYLWDLFFQPPTIALAKGTVPFALLPAATGAFYGNHLDKVELGRRPWRPWEVGSQTLVTALCGLAATLAWLTLGGGVVGNVDFIALATLFTAVVGASLAWYLPQAAASPSCLPSRSLMSESGQTLQVRFSHSVERGPPRSESRPHSNVLAKGSCASASTTEECDREKSREPHLCRPDDPQTGPWNQR
jgi:hypothetical protein